MRQSDLLTQTIVVGFKQVVILGTGIAALEKKVEAITSQFPGRAAGVVEFNSALAHLITAG